MPIRPFIDQLSELVVNSVQVLLPSLDAQLFIFEHIKDAFLLPKFKRALTSFEVSVDRSHINRTGIFRQRKNVEMNFSSLSFFKLSLPSSKVNLIHSHFGYFKLPLIILFDLPIHTTQWLTATPSTSFRP
jgi:hypothetical protein